MTSKQYYFHLEKGNLQIDITITIKPNISECQVERFINYRLYDTYFSVDTNAGLQYLNIFRKEKYRVIHAKSSFI